MTTTYYLNVIFVFGIFILLLYGCLRFAQSFQKKRFTQEIRIIDRLPVDTGTTLAIVSVRNKEYLMGFGGKSVTVLDVLT